MSDGTGDQDAEPTLNAPGEEGPTGIEAEAEGEGEDRVAGNEEAADQDAEPTRHAPGDAGPDNRV